MRKKILLIVTVYRIGERIYPVIPELYKFADIDLLQINEMSEGLSWYGTDDPRVLFHKKYNGYFDKIFDGGKSSIEQYGARNHTPCEVIKNLDVNEYDLVLYDDDRDRHGVWYIYDQVKDRIPMVGNVHGNWWSSLDGFLEKSHIKQFYQKSFNRASVFGVKERDSYNPNDYILSGGIPSNDDLKYYDRTDDFILVIVNLLGNRTWNVPGLDVWFDENFIKESGLLELQKEYDKKVVFKLKSRADHPFPAKDFQYLESIIPKELDYDIIMDFPDNNQLICGSFLVITAPSTFAFKPIQKGIPTILINGAGIVGNFQDYRGLIELGEDNILDRVEKEISLGKDEFFIKNTIEGGLDFTSTEKYVKNIMSLLYE
tara:strand:+ start:64 stop:1179 length:1116 start_codon:yes stop_codon:yes gene_type:complete